MNFLLVSFRKQRERRVLNLESVIRETEGEALASSFWGYTEKLSSHGCQA